MNVQKNDFSALLSGAPAVYLEETFGADLASAQLALEHEAYSLGEARFHKAMERQVKAGQAADNAAMKPLVAVLVDRVIKRTEEWIPEAKAKRGQKPKALACIETVGAEVASGITIKILLGRLAKEENCNMTNVAYSIGQAIEDEAQYGRMRELEGKYFEKHIAKALNQRTDAEHKRLFLAAVADHVKMTAWAGWEKEAIISTGFAMMERVIEATGLIETDTINAGTPNESRCIWMAQEYVDKIALRAFSLAGMAPVHQPMVVQPKAWDEIRGGGYYAAGKKPLNLIRTGSKKALMRYADVAMPEVFAAVNTIQNTAWKINADVLNVVNVIKEMANPLVESMPKFTKQDLPERPEDIDTDPVVLKKWKKAAAGIYRREKARVSRRLSMEFTIEQANKFSKFEQIFFPYNLDWRGRVYAIPMFNPQSDDMGKGLLTLAKGKPLGEKGLFWLMVHCANCASQKVESGKKTDKVDFETRIKWVRDNRQNIIDTANNPLDNTFWADMDSPFCFLAAAIELRNAWAMVEPLEYVCSLPVAFDGSCSGIQHFSAMNRDEVGGAAVNLLPSDEVQDIYQIVADKVSVVLNDHAVNGSANTVETYEDKDSGEISEKLILGTKALALQWLAYGMSRSVTKRSVMTLAYGSKEFGFRDQVLEDIIQPDVDAGNTTFTVPNQAAGYMAKLIWNAVSVTVVKAVEAMKWLQSAAKLLAAEVKDKKSGETIKKSMAVHWVTTDGFPVWQEYRKPEQKRLKLLFLGNIHMQPTINVGEKELDKHKQESGIAPNFVHSMDGCHLRKTIMHCFRKYGITDFAVIHDSFGCCPADADNLFRGVREAMVEAYENHDVMQDFFEQFADQLHESQVDKMPAIPAKGTLDIRSILESDFAFA